MWQAEIGKTEISMSNSSVPRPEVHAELATSLLDLPLNRLILFTIDSPIN